MTCEQIPPHSMYSSSPTLSPRRKQMADDLPPDAHGDVHERDFTAPLDSISLVEKCDEGRRRSYRSPPRSWPRIAAARRSSAGTVSPRAQPVTPKGCREQRDSDPDTPENGLRAVLAMPGWTRARRVSDRGANGFPAHAGTDPRRSRNGSPASGLPRTVPRPTAPPSAPGTRTPADGRLRRRRCPHRRHRRRHVAMGQRPHVPHEVVLGTKHRQDAVARVVGAKLHRDGPLQHRADALAHAARGTAPPWMALNSRRPR